MRANRVVLLAAIIVCCSGLAMAQTEWVDHPDNPVIEPGGPGRGTQAGPGVPPSYSTARCTTCGSPGKTNTGHWPASATPRPPTGWNGPWIRPTRYCPPAAEGEWDDSIVNFGGGDPRRDPVPHVVRGLRIDEESRRVRHLARRQHVDQDTRQPCPGHWVCRLVRMTRGVALVASSPTARTYQMWYSGVDGPFLRDDRLRRIAGRDPVDQAPGAGPRTPGIRGWDAETCTLRSSSSTGRSTTCGPVSELVEGSVVPRGIGYAFSATASSGRDTGQSGHR